MCFMLAAGKAATADGSILVGRSCDATGTFSQVVLAVPRKKYNPGEALRFDETHGRMRFSRMARDGLKAEAIEIPQPPEAYAYITITGALKGDDICLSQGGINEHQLFAGASSGGRLNEEARKVSPRVPTSIWNYRTTLVLERCKTAREVIKFWGELTDKYGSIGTCNKIIADPNEAWLLEEYRAHLWAAVRVPDDCFVVEVNTHRIGEVGHIEPDHIMCSDNLISFAVENCLYNPDSGEPFNAAKVYSTQTGKTPHDIPAPEYDRRRIWRAISFLEASTNLDPEEPTLSYPLFVKPEKKLTPKDFIAVLTDHYQGTKYDHYDVNKDKYKPTEISASYIDPTVPVSESRFHINEKRQYQYAPIWGTERIIGTPRSVATYCAQLRSWMPNPIGGLLWASISEGATSGYTPWYSGITRTPEPYTIGTSKDGQGISSPFLGSIFDERSAYWAFRVVSNLVNLFYTATKDEVIPVWRDWEDRLYELQPAVEKAAIELYEKEPEIAVEFITGYSCAKANEALDMAREMTTRLHTIIAHYNAPL